MSDLTECFECGAMVDRTVKHKNWHLEQEQKVERLESALLKLSNQVTGNNNSRLW